jgi:hypothetical protein
MPTLVTLVQLLNVGGERMKTRPDDGVFAGSVELQAMVSCVIAVILKVTLLLEKVMAVLAGLRLSSVSAEATADGVIRVVTKVSVATPTMSLLAVPNAAAALSFPRCMRYGSSLPDNGRAMRCRR